MEIAVGGKVEIKEIFEANIEVSNPSTFLRDISKQETYYSTALDE